MFAYITEEGAYVQKRGGNFVIGRNNECVMEIPEEVLESLTLIDACGPRGCDGALAGESS